MRHQIRRGITVVGLGIALGTGVPAALVSVLPLPAAAQGAGETQGIETARVVALVMSVGQGGARADAIQASLQVLGAQTLRAIDPNNAELRSLLRRFADAAADTDVAIVYIDAPVLSLEERRFVLPARTVLRRSSDLLTRALPLSAFARASAAAGSGGAVLVAVGAPAEALPAGVTITDSAPEALPGVSPVVLAARGQTDPLLSTLSSAARADTVELGALIAAMAAGDGVSASALPPVDVFLRRPAPPEAEAVEAEAAPIIVAPVQAAVETGTGDGAVAPIEPAPQDIETLAIIEASISRAAKRRLQLGLRDRGHYAGFIDGIFGAQTRAAIEAFQRAEGAPVTGYLTTQQISTLQ
ncbi:MAG: peptidoglycan-binding domain-containing protein [Pseudomonadota bacterium]